MNKSKKPRPDTPQRYGHRRRIVPIRRRIRQRVVLRWLIVLAVGVAIVLLTQIAKPMYRGYAKGYQLSLAMSFFLYVFIVIKSRVFPMTFAKEWVGRVRERRVDKYTRYPKAIYFGYSSKPVMATKCTWTVGLEDGDVEIVSFDTEEVWERYFDIGEKVRMYKNAKLLVKAHPPKGEENLLCPLCGLMVMEPVCRKCGVDFTESEETDSSQ